jgi:hypothetical protein
VTAAIVVLFIVVVIGAGVPLYVLPASDPVGDPDVIEVLGPANPPRVTVAQRLHAEHDVPLLISVASPNRWGRTAALVSACRDDWVLCTTPTPFTTSGEAGLLEEYARDHRVASAVVVTFTPQVSRTRFIYAKCYPGHVAVVGVDEHLSLGDWAYQYLYQSAAFVKALVMPCPTPGRTPPLR